MAPATRTLLGLIILTASCARPPQSQTPAGPEASARDDSAAASGASSTDPSDHDVSSEEQAVLSMRPPEYSGSGEREDALRYLNSDMKEWVARRSKATDDLISKLEAKRASVASKAEDARISRSVAKLQLALSRDFVTAGSRALPKSFERDADLRKAFLGALVDTVSDRLKSAQQQAALCISNATGQDQEQLRSACNLIKSDAERIRPPGVSQSPQSP